ncbi:DUF881 domain-containing protein [Nocardioides marmoriginsengisoli]|uniref:DUF881 domain-containing protein n=1 Tax=Nocardioides marmoriginsengisoli TaxID=661483 RepID=A0A3N0CBW3_9ACTN|nr:DUF881 domain-containing protein [Nocardioides marmoriginsengisoli]RNL60789.1 DUF881 domain-containing protein [Nocardioides marmoriginsengisoli]
MTTGRNESLARWRDLLRFRFRGRWRPAAVAMFVFAGALFVTTSVNSKGLDLRAASITDLDHVVRSERIHANDLQNRVASLNGEVGRLTRLVDNAQVEELQRQVDELREPAGFAPVRGPGLTVVLDDAPKNLIKAAYEPGGITPDELVVHQQDIQAVVNALWAGGAEAMTIQGERVISTTGIKCVGNTVILHGVNYSPPYRISAIGSVSDLYASLDNSVYVDAYKTFVDAYQLGYEVTPSISLEFGGYTGTSALKYAVPGTPDQPSRG